MLERDTAVVVIVDIQEKLARVIHERDALVAAADKLIQGAAALGVPVVYTEQNPNGLGPTVPELAAHLDGEPITKLAFSCCGEPAFTEALAAGGRRQVLLAGIETHVCVYQTVADLLAAGHEVHVVADAVGSRTAANRAIGLARMKDAGAQVTSVEMALFELLKVAEGPAFKAILKIVK